MKKEDLVRHGAYGLAIIVLFNRFISMIAYYIKFSDFYKVLFFGIVSAIAVILGLFKFNKGLSLGFTLGGVICAVQALYYYQIKLTDEFRFVIALIILSIVCYALYLLYKQQGRK